MSNRTALDALLGKRLEEDTTDLEFAVIILNGEGYKEEASEAAAELAALRARLEAVEALAKKWKNKNKYAADVVICSEELAAALKVLK